MVDVGGPTPVKAKISTPARALDTVYRNTTGRPLIVIVSVQLNKNAALDSAYANALVGSTSPPTTTVSECGLHPKANSPAAQQEAFNLAFAVTAGYYYTIQSAAGGTGVVTLLYWTEVEL